MESGLLCACNRIAIIYFAILLFIVGCASSNNAIPEQNVPNIVQNPGNSSETVKVDPKSEPREMLFSYENQSTKISFPLDLNTQEFILDLSGRPAGPVPDSVRLNDPIVQEKLKKDIRQVLRDFQVAQNLLYRQDYSGAMHHIDRSLNTMKTAEAFGLKGTVFFMQGNMQAARHYWNEAVKLDPDIYIPEIPELEQLINEIREQTGDNDL